MGVGSLHILYSLNLNGDLGGDPQILVTLYEQNNPFLGIFQLKSCLNIFETYSLLYVCVLKAFYLAIVLFELFVLGASTKRNIGSDGEPCCVGGSILSCCPRNPHGHERALKEEEKG